MNGGIEAVAIKNLQTILKSRGISSEALFSKYDLDGNGSLSFDEFGSALTSITGQKAPLSIVNAIFSVLDSDGNGYIDLQEILILVDSGPSQSYVNGSSLSISDHPNTLYNGSYEPQGELNGKPLFVNGGGARLYYYDTGSGGAPSWSLDDREQNGSQDYYRGGWTRPPAGGGLPLGTRRWVGVGRISIQISSTADVQAEDIEQITEVELVEEVEDESPGNLMNNVSNEFSEILGGLQNPDFSDLEALEKGRTEMDKQAELRISKLPSFLQPSARELWKVKADSFQDIAISNLAIGATAVAGLSAGALGISSMASNEEKEQVVEQEQPREDTRVASLDAPEIEKIKEEIPAQSESEPEIAITEEPVEEQISRGGHSIHSIVESFTGARMLSEQNSLKEQLSGTPVDVSIKVTSVERTFGIGIQEKYRGGSTIVASLHDQGAPSGHSVEIRIPSGADDSNYKTGYEGKLSCEVSGWNGIRKRLILDAQ